jgi:chromosome segregation ATPase
MKLWHLPIALVILALVGMAWNQHIQAVRAEAIVETLEVERDSALVRIVQLEDQATGAQTVVDSLVTELVTAKAESEVEIRVLEARADSLGNAIISHSEPGPARDSTEALVEALFATHAAEIAEYQNLLTLSESTIQALQNQVRVEQQLNTNLRRALDVTTQQRDAWQMAANPGLITRIKQDAGLLGGAALVGGVLVLAFTGGK